MGPITGLRVLEIGDRGEVAGKLVADAGADLIRVEPREGCRSRHAGPFVGNEPGPNRSLSFDYWNTNKRSLTLAVATAKGAGLWRRLIEDADVVIDSTAPGTLDALGAGHAAAAANEGLVWCSITPFGREGPWRDFVVNDLVSMALGGPVMSTGYDDHALPPIRPDGEHSLAIAGEYAVIGILTVLWQRRSTGQGQIVDVSIHDAVSCSVETSFNHWEYNRRQVQRQTGRHQSPTPTVPWQIECADGRHVALMAGGWPRDERVWNALVAWMDETDSAGELKGTRYPYAASLEERDRIMLLIHDFVRRRPAEAVYRRAQACHLPWGIVRRPEENLDDPHWADRASFVEVEVPGYERPARIPGAPYRFGRTPLEQRRRAPLLGEHNFEILSGELGLSTEEIVALSKMGAI